MALTGSVHDWTKIYTLLRLLGDGNISFGDSGLQSDLDRTHHLKSLIREDESGRVTYQWTDDCISVQAKDEHTEIKKDECLLAASILLKTIREQSETSAVFQVAEISLLLKRLSCTDFSTTATDGSDFSLTSESTTSNLSIKIKSLLAPLYLLPPNRAANFKYDILQVKFSNPETKRINRIEGVDEIRKRLTEIEKLGARLKYTTPENKVFLYNLSMIDLHFPKLMAETTRLFYATSLRPVSDLVEELKRSNPYKIKDELIDSYQFYEYKMKQFLHALACGMRPAKIFRGYGDETPQLWITSHGIPLLYNPAERVLFDNTLFNQVSLSEADCESHKFGFIEKENNQWLFKLNLTLKI